MNFKTYLYCLIVAMFSGGFGAGLALPESLVFYYDYEITEFEITILTLIMLVVFIPSIIMVIKYQVGSVKSG